PRCAAPRAAGRCRSRRGRSSRRCAAWRFFYAGPALAHPAVDGYLVALDGSPRRSLQAPTHAPEDAPHMTGVIALTGNALDHRRDPRQGPEVGDESLRTRTPQQRTLHTTQGSVVEPRRTSGARRGAQGWLAALLPLPMPAAHALPRDSQATADFRLGHAVAKQDQRSESALLQSGTVAAWDGHRRTSTGGCGVHAHMLPQLPRLVTTLRERL